MSQARGGSTRQWRTIRAAVLGRDGWTCRHCHTQLHPRCSTRGCASCAHVDHRTPVAHGGTDHPANLVAACQACNLRRGAAREVPSRPAVTSRTW